MLHFNNKPPKKLVIKGLKGIVALEGIGGL
jgi:hypothetical protein